MNEDTTHTPQPREPGYLAKSRNLVNSFILVAPLFVLYQIGVLVTDGWMNGADFITPRLYQLTGRSTLVYLLVNVGILAAMLASTRFMERRQRPDKTTWIFMLAESALYATILGQVISRILTAIGLSPPRLDMSALDNLVMSLGAGAYEELVFRLLLLSGLVWVMRAMQLEKVWAWVGAIVLSSLVFSGFHYRPVGMESWELWSFSFRFVAGLLFATLYLTRGFAVAAYTHAIYDIHVLVL